MDRNNIWDCTIQDIKPKIVSVHIFLQGITEVINLNSSIKLPAFAVNRFSN